MSTKQTALQTLLGEYYDQFLATTSFGNHEKIWMEFFSKESPDLEDTKNIFSLSGKGDANNYPFILRKRKHPLNESPIICGMIGFSEAFQSNQLVFIKKNPHAFYPIISYSLKLGITPISVVKYCAKVIHWPWLLQGFLGSHNSGSKNRLILNDDLLKSLGKLMLLMFDSNIRNTHFHYGTVYQFWKLIKIGVILPRGFFETLYKTGHPLIDKKEFSDPIIYYFDNKKLDSKSIDCHTKKVGVTNLVNFMKKASRNKSFILRLIA